MDLKHDPIVLYRYRTGSETAEEDDEYGFSRTRTRVVLLCDEFPILKETPCGYWINALEWSQGQYRTRRRFVLKDSRQSFASAIRQEALRSYIYRKQKQLSFIENDLTKAKDDLKEAKRLMDSMKDENGVIIYNPKNLD